MPLSVTRWFRSLHKGLKFIKEDVDECGVRAISIAENLDTAGKDWGDMLALNLLVGEKQVRALPYFVRMGQSALFAAGYQIGACPLGYRPVAVADGVTKLGKPRTRPEIVPEVAELIVRHFELVAGGTPIAEGCRIWNRDIAALPEEVRKYAIDPRAGSGMMRPEAYRRLFKRRQYLGEWVYGRKRNKWLDRRDQVVQVDAPEHEVGRQRWEHLRIVSDELWARVEARLAGETRGRHGPRIGREPLLSSFLPALCRCTACGHIFHQYGRKYMNCPNSKIDKCDAWGTVDRESALQAIIAVLRSQILADDELIGRIVAASREFDSRDAGSVEGELAGLERAVKRQDNVIALIEGSAGDVLDDDARQRHKQATMEKARLKSQIATLKERRSQDCRPVTEEEVRAILADFDQLLQAAGENKLRADGRQRALSLIRVLVGGHIEVSFERVFGVRRAFGRGRFKPALLAAINQQRKLYGDGAPEEEWVEVSFRRLPRYARIAGEVYRLHVEEGVPLSEIGKRFQCTAGHAWGALAYWHESHGLEVSYKREGVKRRHNRPA